MLDLENVTLIAVTSVRIEAALWALKYSSKYIRFAVVKLLTHETISDEEVKIVKIDKLDYDGYSKFIVYELHKYFDTDFVLLIQDDGYIINPHLWKSEFLTYDYIGAPWEIPNDNYSYRDPFGNIRRVGNGGFSLRSKKLSRLAADLNLPWQSFHGYYHEDGFICVNNAHIYEKHGCIFAPLEIAVLFSQEIELLETRGVEPFGFHGKCSKYNIKKNRSSGKSVKTAFGRRHKRVIFNLLQRYSKILR